MRPATAITHERIERALRAVAVAVSGRGGERYVAIFERLERELEQRRRSNDTVARARAMAMSGER